MRATAVQEICVFRFPQFVEEQVLYKNAMAWTTLLLLLGCLVTVILCDGCIYKECLCNGAAIYCDYRHLQLMPQKLSDEGSFESLDLGENQIPSIPAGSLPANLTTLTLIENPIETIDDTAFDDSIYTLNELSFSNAKFTKFPDAVFHLKALRQLSVYDTSISVWNDTGMRQIAPGLDTFTVYSVGLTTWPTWVKSMTNLTELTISGNSISTIPDDALDLMSDSLTHLSLDNNSLTTLPKSLVNMTALKWVALDHNRIIDVTYLPQLTHLSTLSLNNNRITDAQSLSNALKTHGNTLFQLDIHDNELTSIPDLSFFTRIYIQDLSHNRISDPNSGSVPQIFTQLNLGNNFLSSIPQVLKGLNRTHRLELQANTIRVLQGSDFPSSTIEADFSSNLITQLTRSSFPDNSSINWLTLSNNPISLVSNDAFYNLPLLSMLFLGNTQLTRLPLAIASLTKLTYFDVTNSSNLVCTCDEQSLQTSFRSLDMYSILGDCGEESVFIFFTQLSPSCPPLSLV